MRLGPTPRAEFQAVFSIRLLAFDEMTSPLPPYYVVRGRQGENALEDEAGCDTPPKRKPVSRRGQVVDIDQHAIVGGHAPCALGMLNHPRR